MISSPASSRIGTYTPEPIPKEAYQAPEDNHLNANAFNEGYYEKFFIEMHKLGKGFRGSVFLCEVKKRRKEIQS
jgi:hypothetical protein